MHLALHYFFASLLLLAMHCHPQEINKPITPTRSADEGAAPENKYSPALRALVRQARTGSAIPVEIETFTLNPSRPAPFQGRTGYWSDRIVINVTAGLSKAYDEALLAHELFHVILRNQGFNAGVGRQPDYRIPGISSTDSEESLSVAETYINSCFPDELIDRETAKRGFRSALLTNLQAKQTLEQMKATNDSDRAIRSQPILQRVAAVNLFCLAIRHPSSIQIMDKAVRALSPEIIKAERELLRKFKGSRCRLDDPKGCYALTIRLRDAAGFERIIFLRNPSTSKWE